MNDKETYFPNLDGLRFLSFLSVFLFHSFYTQYDHIKGSWIYAFVKFDVFGNGNLGVNFFFVLSGFLITYLLLKEKKVFHKIDVINFWTRRVLRIWPLFYLCLLLGFILTPMLKEILGQESNETANLILYLTFLNNFDFITKGPPDASILSVLWSIAVEEQFYLIWPIFLLLLPVRLYPWLFIFIILSSILFRALYDDPIYNEYHTLSCIGDMAIGALGSWLVQLEFLRNRLIALSKATIASIYIIFLLAYLLRDEVLFSSYWIRVVERPVLAIVFLMIILEQSYSENSFFKLGRSRFISSMGKISYGLYCFQFVGITFVTQLTRFFHLNTSLWEVMILETMFALTITIFIASCSYHYFESPFLRIKNKFSRV